MHSDRDGRQTTRDVSELLADLERGLRGDRHAQAASALAAAKTEEAGSLELLAHLERDLRNITRVYRRLLDERNALADRASRLHKAIRHIEPVLGEEPHRDHRVDLGRKGVVQYVADECWRMDNREDWDFEVGAEDGDCPIEQVTYAWASPRFRVIHEGAPEGDDSESEDAAS